MKGVGCELRGAGFCGLGLGFTDWGLGGEGLVFVISLQTVNSGAIDRAKAHIPVAIRRKGFKSGSNSINGSNSRYMKQRMGCGH